MNTVFYIIFSILIFLTTLIGYKKFRSTTLYALAIGGVVNANFFHAGKYPINCFGLPFGIDSVIYTLFAFCVILMFFNEGKKSAYLLAFSSIIAIFFSALMQLVADLLSQGSSIAVWNTFFTFCISILASIIGVIVMLEILDKIKGKFNQYILCLFGILIISIINTGIYSPLTTLINGTPANITTLLLTSFLGKFLSLLISLFTLWLINFINKPKQKNKN